MSSLGQILYFLLPVILGGVSNMVFVKLPVATRLKRPMDGGWRLNDGERLLGENKTWKGFLGMILFTSLWMAVVAYVSRTFPWAGDLSLIRYEAFRFPFNEWFYGALWGFGYVLFELPNSYVKRRLNIPPGRNASGLKGILFTFIDQADSVIGCMVFMLFFYVPSVTEAVLIFLVGTGVHYVVNVLLFGIRLKNQPA